MLETTLSKVDRIHLRRAVELALRGRYTVSPNPPVGCVVVKDQEVVGEGWHERPGEAHAEVNALNQAGERARGATLYVSLEPCSHHGRTPPCAQRVVEAGVARVVACTIDPNPEVQGRGFEYLMDHGVAVTCTDERELIESAIEGNLAYFVNRVRNRPLVTLKWAMTLDGRIATVTGESQWISGPEARAAALDLREEHDAILVGSGTVLADDPRLDRRRGLAHGPIVRVVMDRRLRLRPEARLFEVPGPVLIYTEARGSELETLRQAGSDTVVQRLPEVTPKTVVEDLRKRGVCSVLVEGGGELHGAFVSQRLVDRVWVCCAPRLVGGADAFGPVAGDGLPHLADAISLHRLHSNVFGSDIVLEGVEEECLQGLFKSVAVSAS